ncbi:MAG: DUF4082 domain-containing protein, partial [Candidatus Acidiferrum sp.]
MRHFADFCLFTKEWLVGAIVVLACATCLSAQTPVTIWPSSAVPSTIDAGADSAVELGVRFTADTSGTISGIRFYKGALNTGTHVGNLWSSTGSLLASVTFTAESSSGWQQVNFPKPVAVTANTLYVASYHSTNGHFSVTANYFATSGANNPPLHAQGNLNGGANGVYAYGAASQFPTSTYNSANYWVDVVFTAAATSPAQHTIWPSTAKPTTPDVGSDSPVELGVRFYSDTPGTITGIRFYKSPANTGTHVGNLWSGAGALLGSATFTAESASGWQQVDFARPVTIAANTAYVASYHTTIGHYSGDANYFATAGINNSPLHTYANTSTNPDGPYSYGSSSQFPGSTYNSANYWVDVVFSSSGGGSGGTPLSVSTTSLSNGTQSVAYSQSLAAVGGTPPYTWSLSSGKLPTGLSVAASGAISGTPTVAGSSSFAVTVKDSASASASANLSINVVAAAPATVAISSPANGATVSGSITVSGVASDGLSMTSVQVSVDGGTFANASGTANWTFA